MVLPRYDIAVSMCVVNPVNKISGGVTAYGILTERFSVILATKML